MLTQLAHGLLLFKLNDNVAVNSLFSVFVVGREEPPPSPLSMLQHQLQGGFILFKSPTINTALAPKDNCNEVLHDGEGKTIVTLSHCVNVQVLKFKTSHY